MNKILRYSYKAYLPTNKNVNIYFYKNILSGIKNVFFKFNFQISIKFL